MIFTNFFGVDDELGSMEMYLGEYILIHMLQPKDRARVLLKVA
jgi:hypothetical protein